MLMNKVFFALALAGFAAFLLNGSVETQGQDFVLGAGESVSFGEYALEVIDFSEGRAVAFSLAKQETIVSTWTRVEVNQTVSLAGLSVSLTGFTEEGKARLRLAVEEEAKELNREEALALVEEELKQYPSKNVVSTEGSCNGRGTATDCWVFSGHVKGVLPSKQMALGNKNVDLPSYSFLKGAIVYVDKKTGEVTRRLNVN